MGFVAEPAYKISVTNDEFMKAMHTVVAFSIPELVFTSYILQLSQQGALILIRKRRYPTL